MARARTVLLDPYNGGLAVARALVRRGEDVTVIAGEVNGFATRTRGARGRIAGPAAWLAALGEAAAAGVAIVLTGGDAASAFLAESAAIPAGLATFEALDRVHIPLMRKDDSDRLARAAGVLVPWTRVITNLTELSAATPDAPYPVIVKPVLSHRWRAVFGDERVMLAHDSDAACRAVQRALEADLHVVMSEYVPGGDDDVEEAILVRAPDGSYPVHFGCRKIRQFPVGFGAASLCEVAELPETMELARAVLDTAGFVGVAGVETKRHAGTGERYFLEVNVRIPTQWGLGDAGGLNASARLADTLRGESLPPQAPLRRQARLVFPELEVRAALAALRRVPAAQRARTALDLARSYRGVREVGLLDPRDPAPLAAYVSRAVGRRVRRRT